MPGTDPLAVRLLSIFAEELEEQLAEMHASIAALRREPENAMPLRALLRVTHTLKGAARAAGLPQIEQLCHALETELAQARDAGVAATSDLVAMLLEAADALSGARERIASGAAPDAEALSAALQRVRRGAQPMPRTAAAADALGQRKPSADTSPEPRARSGIPSAQATAEVQAHPVSPVSIGSTSNEGASALQGASDGPPAVPAALEGEPQPPIADVTTLPVEDKPRTENSVRISIQHVEAITAAGAEIALLAAQLADFSTHLARVRSQIRESSGIENTEASRHLDSDLLSLARRSAEGGRSMAAISSRLDSALRHVRQRPVHELTDPLERVARDVARDLAREIVVVSTGTRIEVDRVVLEALREPLLHIVRNAVDHGIEAPDARVRAGKTPAGQLEINASLHGDRIRLAVVDDGGGIDLGALRSALIREGRPVPTSDMALADSIFDEGVSTRESLTTLSGRGVGMSIVREAMERLGGTVDVTTSFGKGTRITLDVPISVATIRAMIVRVGAHTVAVPSAFIQRGVRARSERLKRIDNQDMLLTEHGPVPLMSLGALLGAPYVSEPWPERVPALMLDVSNTRFAVAVDEMLEERELVLRPLEHVSAAAAAITVGSALVTTGEAVLVISIPALASELGRAHSRGSSIRKTTTTHVRVLVVDDSITSRTLEESVLSAAGYDVTTAVNGLEAWLQLERTEFAIVVSDVEMPELDGIGLCKRIRANAATANLPVILVTSLDQPEHRARGLEAGADAYVAKSSFDQDVLLDTVRQLIGKAEGTA